jgi:hypothetical protein
VRANREKEVVKPVRSLGVVKRKKGEIRPEYDTITDRVTGFQVVGIPSDYLGHCEVVRAFAVAG